MKPEQLRNQVLAADLAWIPLALAAEQALCAGIHCRHQPLGPLNFVIYLVCTVFAWVLLSENLGLDGFRGGWRMPALVSRLLLAIGLLMVLLLAVENVAVRYVGQVTLSVFALFLLKGFLAIRWLMLRRVFRRHRKENLRRVVILGSDRLAAELAAKFQCHPELLSQVVGFLWPGAEARPSRSSPAEGSDACTVSTLDVIQLLRQQRVDELVIAHPPASREVLDLVALCRKQAIQVSLVPQPYELYLTRPHLLDLGGLPLLQLGEMPPAAAAGAGKRIVDLVLGGALALAALPVVALAAAALRFFTGQGFRWEQRIGWKGAEFSMLRLNVDHNPPHSSRFARLLWHFSLSELPQLWNVVRGEMSLVGPRPETPERVNLYSPWQQQRLSVKPGITGLAQVHGLREQHASEDKTRYDLQYMLHPSLLKDLSLLIETVWTLTLRLLYLRRRTVSGQAGEGAAQQAVWHFPTHQPFSEILPHAHRTQSGSD